MGRLSALGLSICPYLGGHGLLRFFFTLWFVIRSLIFLTYLLPEPVPVARI